jgi:glycosyltransferase involved in cell wall biosynthesis
LAKILQVCAVDFTVKNLLLPIINKLKKEGFEVEIACSKGEEALKLEKQGHVFRFVKIDRKFSPISNLMSITGLFNIMKSGKYDLVHVHTPSASILARIAAKLARVPIVIYTAHGFYFHDNMSKFEYKFFTTLEKILGRYFTDYIFVQSEEDYRTAKQLRIIEENKITCISNGVDLEKFNIENVQIDTVSFKTALGIPPEGKVITFIGRLVKEKGIIDLIDAFAKLARDYRDVFLLIIGDVTTNERDNKTKEKIEEILENVNFKDRFIITGYREDIPEILEVSDIFILPSYREGMPRSIIEAMAMKLPVIATSIRGAREEVLDGETGFLVPVGNVKALGDAMLKLVRDSELRKSMGENGRMRVEKFFDESKVIEKELFTINELLAKLNSRL